MMDEIDVTDLITDWFKDHFSSMPTWGATGRLVLVEPEIDKVFFNRAVTAAFTEWNGSFCYHSHLYEDVLAKAIAREEQRLQFEFTSTPYERDHVCIKFATFLDQCWRMYCKLGFNDVWPLTALLQSSGYGKSRLLFELAKATKDARGADAFMRVLYVSTRNEDNKPKQLPRPTPALREYFLSNRDRGRGLVDRLYRLFTFAMSCWNSVGSEWIKLFTDAAADASTLAQFKSFDADAHARASKICGVEDTRRVLVFAIDDVQEGDSDRLGLLGEAFASANKKIRGKYGKFAGLFAVLVNARVEATSRTFPPFVLNQTIDAMLDPRMKSAKLHDMTLVELYQKHHTWDPLWISMGRPLWKSCVGRIGFLNVIELAASKLLCGRSPATAASFDDATMGGVASMLCRLGVSLNSFSAQAVTTYMAQLLHVTTSQDALVSVYSSDPVLTFGASRVWYAAADEDDHHSILHRHILPQLTALVREQAVDIGDPGVLVARIVLLLAMDTVGALTTGDKNARCYTGQSYDVLDLLRVLHNGSTEVRAENFSHVATAADEMEAFVTHWRRWQVAFSHFVELSEEPDEECLWAMIARRAAGVVGRDLDLMGVHLIIPVFKDSQVSMILVQVRSQQRSDSYPPDFVLTATRPKSLFACSSFKEKASKDVLRVYLGLRIPPQCSPRRYFLRDSTGLPFCKESPNSAPTPAEPPPFVVYLRGVLQKLTVRVDSSDADNVVWFISKEVAAALTNLLEQTPSRVKFMEADLAKRVDYFGIDPSDLLALGTPQLASSSEQRAWDLATKGLDVDLTDEETEQTEDALSQADLASEEERDSRKRPNQENTAGQKKTKH